MCVHAYNIIFNVTSCVPGMIPGALSPLSAAAAAAAAAGRVALSGHSGASGVLLVSNLNEEVSVLFHLNLSLTFTYFCHVMPCYTFRLIENGTSFLRRKYLFVFAECCSLVLLCHSLFT